MVSGKRIILTGGAGFIGTALAQALADDNALVVYDSGDHTAFGRTDLGSHPNVTILDGDVLDREPLRRAADGANVIVHLASIVGVNAVIQNPVHTIRVNLIGTANVFDVASELDTLEQVVDFSTSEVFGRKAYMVEETHETSGGSVGEARWSYAVSKLAGEYLGMAYFDESHLPISLVRPFNIYGPNQVVPSAVHHFIVRCLAGGEIAIHGDGSQIRAWCYIDDLVQAVLRLLSRPEAIGQAFNIGNPRSVCTTYDLAQRIRRLTASSSKLVFKPLTYSDVEIRIPDIKKAREVLEWEPLVDLDEGLERTIAWYRERVLAPA